MESSKGFFRGSIVLKISAPDFQFVEVILLWPRHPHRMCDYNFRSKLMVISRKFGIIGMGPYTGIHCWSFPLWIYTADNVTLELQVLFWKMGSFSMS